MNLQVSYIKIITKGTIKQKHKIVLHINSYGKTLQSISN